MDFAGARPRVERLDPALLPALYLAWRSDAAEASHAVHGGLRERGGRAARAGRDGAARRPRARGGATRCARRSRRLRHGPWTPRSTSARRSWTSILATWRWCAPPAPPAPAPTTRAPAGRSWVPCRQPASSLSRTHCARWAARSSRRVSGAMTTLAPLYRSTERQSACPSRAQTTSSRSRTRRSTASRRGPSPSCRSSRSASSCWQVWADAAALERPRRLRDPLRRSPGLGITVGFHRLFTHRCVRDEPALRGVFAVLRLGRDRGPGHLLGRRPSQAPRLLRPAGRPAQPARRPRRRLARRAARPRARAHGLAVPPHPARRRASATRPT